jgi:nucleotide-binding universal stress UspA family protein
MSVPRVILLPSDESAGAEGARAVAEALASRFGATLHDLYVAEVLDSSAEYEWPADIGLAPPAPAGPASPAASRTVRALRISDSPGRGILTYAREVGADLIVMGTHGRDGLERLVRGSTSEHVLRRADCPVLLVPPTADTRSFAADRIVAAYDFSAPASGALATAVELAGTLGLPLDLLHVVEVTYVSSPYGPVTAPVDYEALRRRAARLLSAVASSGTVRPRPATRVGSAVEETLEHARDVRASLIVVGSHGRRGVRRLVLGSVAEGIARRAPCPVLVVPAAASRDAAEQDADVELAAA